LEIHKMFAILASLSALLAVSASDNVATFLSNKMANHAQGSKIQSVVSKAISEGFESSSFQENAAKNVRVEAVKQVQAFTPLTNLVSYVYTTAACTGTPVVSEALITAKCISFGSIKVDTLTIPVWFSIAVNASAVLKVDGYADSTCAVSLFETFIDVPKSLPVPFYVTNGACVATSSAGIYVKSVSNVAVTGLGYPQVYASAYASYSKCGGAIGGTTFLSAQFYAGCTVVGTSSINMIATSTLGTYNSYANTACTGTATPTTVTVPLGCDATAINTVFLNIAAYYNSGSSSSSSVCFSGSSEVTMESGAIKQISDVVVGDRVLAYSSKTQSAVFSDVVAVPHAKNNNVAEFVQITTESGKTIKMTSEHLIQSCNGLVAASKIASGSCVVTVDGQENVSTVDKVVEEGLYTVVTGEELVVINKIVASPFAVNHFIPNMFYNFHRFMFGLLPNFLSTKMMESVATVADEVAQYYTVATDSL